MNSERGDVAGIGLRVPAEVAAWWNGDFNAPTESGQAPGTEHTEKREEREKKWRSMSKWRRRGVRLYPCPGTPTPGVREL